MPRKTSIAPVSALAQFRYLLRGLLVQSDRDARAAGLLPQQYLLLLYLLALPDGKESDTQYLAERLMIKHHSAVGLIDRAHKSGLVERVGSSRDHRKKIIQLTPKGRSVITDLTQIRLKELNRSSHALIHALEDVLGVLKKEAERGNRELFVGEITQMVRDKSCTEL